MKRIGGGHDIRGKVSLAFSVLCVFYKVVTFCYILPILNIYSVFEVINPASHGELLVLLIHVSFTHRLKRRVVSSIYFFPEGPIGSINIFLFHWMIFSYVLWVIASNRDPANSSIIMSFVITLVVPNFWFSNTVYCRSLFQHWQKFKCWTNPRFVLKVLPQMPNMTFCCLVWDEFSFVARVSVFCGCSMVEIFFDKGYHL